MSIKGECTFILLDFVIIGLYTSFANSLLEIFSFLIPLPEVRPFWNPSYFGSLAILNALSRNTLSANVYLFKSLKSP